MATCHLLCHKVAVTCPMVTTSDWGFPAGGPPDQHPRRFPLRLPDPMLEWERRRRGAAHEEPTVRPGGPGNLSGSRDRSSGNRGSDHPQERTSRAGQRCAGWHSVCTAGASGWGGGPDGGAGRLSGAAPAGELGQERCDPHVHTCPLTPSCTHTRVYIHCWGGIFPTF